MYQNLEKSQDPFEDLLLYLLLSCCAGVDIYFNEEVAISLSYRDDD
jgi:hypothetical protein